MCAVIFAISLLVALVPTVNTLYTDTSYHNVSAADALAIMVNATFDPRPAPIPDTCPDDYPECSCYGEGQSWCGPSPNDCEAKRNILDIIQTLCTFKPVVDNDRWYSWRNKKVYLGDSIYKCWPVKTIPLGSEAYHVIFRIKNVGHQVQWLNEDACIELLKRPLGCNHGGKGDRGGGVEFPGGVRWKYRTDPDTGFGIADDDFNLKPQPWHHGCRDHRHYPPLTRYTPSVSFTWSTDLGTLPDPRPPETTSSDVHTTEVSTITVSPTTTETKTVTSTDTLISTSTSTTIGSMASRDPFKKIVTVTVAAGAH